MADWRIDNAKWTRGAVLRFKKYASSREDWDHGHCERCWAKFMESGPTDVLSEGYVTEDNRRWRCPECSRDLKDAMGWKLA
jgi:DNA-directed RNA polymerase subunit RPC12/RpoP